MKNSDIMVALLRSLKVEMNGAVVEAMESRGVRYPLSYGVSLPTIKSISEQYGINHSLAMLLYRQQVRELRIAALYVADPTQVTLQSAEFWAEGITTGEMAEIVAMKIIAKSPDAEQIVNLWIESPSDFIKYAALMGAARAAQADWNIEKLRSLAESFSKDDNIILQHGAEMLLARQITP